MKYVVVTSPEDKTYKNVYIETDNGIKLFGSDGKPDEFFDEWYSLSDKKPKIGEIITSSTYSEITEGDYSGDYEAKIRELFGE